RNTQITAGLCQRPELVFEPSGDAEGVLENGQGIEPAIQDDLRQIAGQIINYKVFCGAGKLSKRNLNSSATSEHHHCNASKLSGLRRYLLDVATVERKSKNGLPLRKGSFNLPCPQERFQDLARRTLICVP